jgi:hypothetical protein
MEREKWKVKKWLKIRENRRTGEDRRGKEGEVQLFLDVHVIHHTHQLTIPAPITQIGYKMSIVWVVPNLTFSHSLSQLPIVVPANQKMKFVRY